MYANNNNNMYTQYKRIFTTSTATADEKQIMDHEIKNKHERNANAHKIRIVALNIKLNSATSEKSIIFQREITISIFITNVAVYFTYVFAGIGQKICIP